MGLLEIVLGHLPMSRLREAALEGHHVARAQDQDFPLIVAEPGRRCNGLLLQEVTPEEKARLDYYELGFGYELRRCTVEGAEALVYFPQEGLWHVAEPWCLASWTEQHWPVTQHAAKELMALFGKLRPVDIPLVFERIKARAFSRHIAQSEAAPTELRRAGQHGDIEVSEVECCHLGYFRTDRLSLSFPRFDGGQSGPLSREVFLTGDAALVLPYDPQRDRVLLIEQFRMGPFGRGDCHPWTLEPIAGRIDFGETPEEAAAREALEEAGLTLDRLLPVANYYPSPGEVSTYFHTFVGLCDLTDGIAGLGGLSCESEDIRSHLLSFEEAELLMQTGEINVGPLLHLLLWLKGERSRLKRG